jgi:hypothetical protein
MKWNLSLDLAFTIKKGNTLSNGKDTLITKHPGNLQTISSMCKMQSRPSRICNQSNYCPFKCSKIKGIAPRCCSIKEGRISTIFNIELALEKHLATTTCRTPFSKPSTHPSRSLKQFFTATNTPMEGRPSHLDMTSPEDNTQGTATASIAMMSINKLAHE